MARPGAPLSQQLRNASVEALEEVGKPMTAHEIEAWISKNHLQLNKELVTKCYDYVRIILSLSSAKCIVKYRSTTQLSGIDHRSSFFGLADTDYNRNYWVIIVA
jgi:hypothetical protein